MEKIEVGQCKDCKRWNNNGINNANKNYGTCEGMESNGLEGSISCGCSSDMCSFCPSTHKNFGCVMFEPRQ